VAQIVMDQMACNFFLIPPLSTRFLALAFGTYTARLTVLLLARWSRTGPPRLSFVRVVPSLECVLAPPFFSLTILSSSFPSFASTIDLIHYTRRAANNNSEFGRPAL